MTHEEMERTMQFILEHQARFDANMERIEEKLDQLTVKHAALEDVVMKLAESHIQLVNSHKSLADSQRRLTEVQTETGERLDAFIVFVEKYISSRNGGEPPH